MVEIIRFLGLDKCFHVFNDTIDLVATTERGPNIVRFGFVGDRNEFLEKTPWGLGGHGIKHAPESQDRTLIGIDQVTAKEYDEFVRLTQPTEKPTGIQKEMDIPLILKDNHLSIVHRLYNRGLWPVELAPWTSTFMSPCGKAILPLPARRPYGRDTLLPSSLLAIWAYCDLSDPRLIMGKKYVMPVGIGYTQADTGGGVFSADFFTNLANNGFFPECELYYDGYIYLGDSDSYGNGIGRIFRYSIADARGTYMLTTLTDISALCEDTVNGTPYIFAFSNPHQGGNDKMVKIDANTFTVTSTVTLSPPTHVDLGGYEWSDMMSAYAGNLYLIATDSSNPRNGYVVEISEHTLGVVKTMDIGTTLDIVNGEPYDTYPESVVCYDQMIWLSIYPYAVTIDPDLDGVMYQANVPTACQDIATNSGNVYFVGSMYGTETLVYELNNVGELTGTLTLPYFDGAILPSVAYNGQLYVTGTNYCQDVDLVTFQFVIKGNLVPGSFSGGAVTDGQWVYCAEYSGLTNNMGGIQKIAIGNLSDGLTLDWKQFCYLSLELPMTTGFHDASWGYDGNGTVWLTVDGTTKTAPMYYQLQTWDGNHNYDGLFIWNGRNQGWMFNGNISEPDASYFTLLTMTVGSTEVLKFQPNTIIQGTVLPNLDDGTHATDGVIHWGTALSGVTTTFGGFMPVTTATAPVSGGGGSPTSQYSSGMPPLTSEGNFSNIPGSGVIDPVLTSSDIPLDLFWDILIFAGILGLGFAIMVWTNQIWIAGVACSVGFAIFSYNTNNGIDFTGGVLPFWTVIVCILATIIVGVMQDRGVIKI